MSTVTAFNQNRNKINQIVFHWGTCKSSLSHDLWLHLCFVFVEGRHDFPSAGSHEAGRWCLSVTSELSHLGAGNEEEVPVAGRVVECHLTLGLVVGGHNEGDDGELSKAGGHGQDLGGRNVSRCRVLQFHFPHRPSYKWMSLWRYLF